MCSTISLAAFLAQMLERVSNKGFEQIIKLMLVLELLSSIIKLRHMAGLGSDLDI